MAIRTGIRTDTGAASQPNLESVGRVTPKQAQATSERFGMSDSRPADVVGSRAVSKVFQIPSALRGGLTQAQELAMNVLINAAALTMFPNNRSKDGGEGGPNPTSGV